MISYPFIHGLSQMALSWSGNRLARRLSHGSSVAQLPLGMIQGQGTDKGQFFTSLAQEMRKSLEFQLLGLGEEKTNIWDFIQYINFLGTHTDKRTHGHISIHIYIYRCIQYIHTIYVYNICTHTYIHYIALHYITIHYITLHYLSIYLYLYSNIHILQIFTLVVPVTLMLRSPWTMDWNPWIKVVPHSDSSVSK